MRFSFENFRTWYDSAGGYFPPDGLHYSLSDGALALDRGEISFEAGLALKNAPKVVFKYTHRYRDGEKGSTVWGPVDDSGGNLYRVYPAIESVDETSDTFQLDLDGSLQKDQLRRGHQL